MSTIQSNASSAQASATAISSGSAGIGAVSSGSKDSNSSYSGKGTMDGAIDNEAFYSHQVSEQISQFVSFVHAMASEFEAVDAGLGAQLSTPTTSLPSTTPKTTKTTDLPYTNYFK
ncbi:TIGR04197 family type VII secretion effector [Streptococcus loxodontisalivarius]|uniref:Type VII secretion effector (TIGR04197 family) n=1 Tax=Streptococcus loxodontisalivarius TaxID=1349415 RepID=A0ABS2PT04_9STRE|nr:TIGR04197 family type VII secretion effector [Streptococcus loxodontisalivarius]MBM7643058.1 type VII secretion effector (TIGR04197 family) [Streptococcus loxodontisalivarius]